MNPTAVFSKSGKGVQEASGKTSHLSRADRAVLAAFDGRITVSEVAEKIGKPFDPKFEQLIEQLEKDGFVRQVSAGMAPPQPASRPGAAGKAAPPPAAAAEELDFTIFAAPKAAPARPASPPPPVDHSARAREEAERKAKEEQAASYKARQEIERARAEAEARAKAAAQARLQAEAAAKAKAEAEARGKADTEASARAKAAEAEAKVRAEAEAKVKAAREAAVRAAAEAKAKAEADLQAKLEAERAKAREEAERIRKEAEEKARREAEELRQRLEEERKAREEADAARRKAEQQAREEAEEKARREAEELRQRLEEERKAREAAEAARKKAEEQAREEERRRREEDERRARDEAERKAREEQERAEREERERAEQQRAEREQQERKERQRAEREQQEREEKAEEQAVAAPASAGGFSDSLLADLDSFGQREDEEKKAREEAEAAKKKAEKQARAEAERRSREEAERREQQEAERKAREAAERKAKEEAERRAKEEAKQAEEREAEERKRKARESVAAKAGVEDDADIGVTDEDLDMNEVKRDQKTLSQEARRAAREREREQERERQRARDSARRDTAAEAPAAPPKIRRPIKWGKPITLGLFVLLVAAIGAVHVMPISTAEYETAASDALGVPVKIRSARVSLFTGVQLKFDNVTVGPARIASARAFPAVGSLFGEKKTFSRIELDGVTVPQQAIGAVLLSRAKGANFEVGRIVAQKVKLEGPFALPLLDADLRVGPDGSLSGGTVRGPENLSAKLQTKGSEVEFEVHADSFALPVAPEVTLNQFGMTGVAGRSGMDVPSWSATLYDGVLSGNAKLTWGSRYSLDGVVTVRGMNVAVFAPALVSEGKVEGTGRFSMNGLDAAKLGDAARLEGSFNITKGVLGSIDISRAISTGGRQASGRTPFTELVGQGVYDKGAVQLRNVTIGAGALNAGASADIARGGALSGRIVADVRAASQTLRATLNLGGTVKEPQVRN